MVIIYYKFNGWLVLQEEADSVQDAINHLEVRLGDKWEEYEKDPEENTWMLCEKTWCLIIEIEGE